MVFDFGRFGDIVSGVYRDSPYSIDDVLFVFLAYFAAYEESIGRPHPNINAEQISRIMAKMPYVGAHSNGSSICDISPEEYPAIIDRHFATRYHRCDYNINHFFSGRIRELRWYEVTAK